MGGGRYDNLMAQVGGDPLPAVGFAMGDLTLGLALESFGLVPKEIRNTPADKGSFATPLRALLRARLLSA